MKNLKKLVSVVLSLAMIVSTMAISVSAADFGDVDKSANYYEAVSVLADLGILEGDTEGNFNGEADIKRSEFAAVVCRAMGQENAAQGSRGMSVFTDVAPGENGHWANGYIAWASQQGIVSGRGDGIFDPDAPVKYEEAVKMLVSALGYAPLAENRGGYPTGYFVIAASEGINSGVNLASSANAPRSVVAQLTYNALDVPLMDSGYAFYNGYQEYNVYDGTDYARRTLLSYWLGVTKVRAEVENTAISDPNLAKRNGDKQVELRLTNAYKFAWEDILDGRFYTNDANKRITLSAGDTDAEDYLGYTVVAYIAEDDDGYGDYVLKSIVPDTRSVDILEVTKLENAETDYDDAYFAYYENETDLRPVEVDLASSFTVYMNGRQVSDPEDAFNRIADTASKVTFLGSKSSGEYDKVFITEYAFRLVEEVDLEEETISTTDGDIELSEDATGSDFSYTLELEDGTPITLEDLQENDMLNIICANPDELLDDPDVKYMDIIVTRKTVEGSVSKQDTEGNEPVYEINGVKYKIYDKKVSINVGDSGRYILTIDDRIFAIDGDWESAEGTGRSYGFLTKVGETESFGEKTIQVKMFTPDGAFVVYDFADTVTVYDATGKRLPPMKKANSGQASLMSDIEAAIEDQVDEPAAAAMIPKRMVSYKLNPSNQIREIRFACTSNETGAFNYVGPDKNENTSFSSRSGRFLGYTYTDKSVLIYAPVSSSAKGYNIDENDLEIVNIAGLDSDLSYNNSYIFDYDRSREFKIAVSASGNVNSNNKAALAIVTGTATLSDGMLQISFLQNGQRLSYAVDDNALDSAVDDITVGDIFQYTLSGDVISKLTVIADYEKTLDGITIDLLESGSGKVTYELYTELTDVGSSYLEAGDNTFHDFASSDDVGTVAIYDTNRSGSSAAISYSRLGSLKENKKDVKYITVVRKDDGLIVDGIQYQMPVGTNVETN